MKSNEDVSPSDYLELVEAVYIDATTKCSADVSDLRDLITIKSRVKNEGMSFLTITLPQFAKDFERSLAIGYIDSTAFRSFRKVGSIPAFLQGMISQIFNRETGEFFHDKVPPIGGPSFDYSTIVESVRQICLTFKKVELPCTPERVQKAMDGFVSIEQSFETFSVPQEDYAAFCDVSSMLWSDLVADFSTTLCTPKHGPGATAERVSGNQKYLWQFWFDRLEPYFPLIDNGYPLGIPSDSEELKLVTIVPEDQEFPVRVVPVPKTLKTPRIIAIEPCCMQFAQQGVRDFLYDYLERHWLTSGRINFRDQSINQQLAMTSSATGQLATIDLSDASDRVPRSLVYDMLKGVWTDSQELVDTIDACRSRMAQLPDGRLIGPLGKFASMGSALCFPIEAMFFYTVCVVALLKDSGLSCSTRNIFKVSRSLYVYGDDIIVPSTNAEIVLEHLRKFNCKVNTEKTFVSGNFRESCGVDAFGGYEVTPTYLRQPRPKNKQQFSRIVSWIATANLFYLKGYWHTAQLLFNQLEEIIGTIPYVLETSPAIGRISFLGYESIGRWNSNLQRNEVLALVPEPVYRTDELEGYGALTKCFLSFANSERKFGSSSERLCDRLNSLAKLEIQFGESVDDLRLKRSARHGAVALKRRWAPTH